MSGILDAIVENYVDWWRDDPKSAFTATFAVVLTIVVGFTVHWINTAGV